MNRNGGPLGITIASSGERHEPVLISYLAPDGLAEKYDYRSLKVFSNLLLATVISTASLAKGRKMKITLSLKM